MNEPPLIDLCQRVRSELVCLGELGHRLLDVVTVIERLAGTSTVELPRRRTRSAPTVTCGATSSRRATQTRTSP
jgi:hypothetical protein